jgi:hypothetical protein
MTLFLEDRGTMATASHTALRADGRAATATARGLLVALLLVGCGEGQARESGAGEAAEDVVRAEVVATSEDSLRVAETFVWAAKTRADTLPFGDLVVAVGRRFLGAPYVAGSLDPAGPERLVVNLRAFDCVTFVESSLALARAIREGAAPDDFGAFVRQLARIRYRDGGHGYTDRLHYFSEWIAANTARGIVEDVTHELGGHVDARPIDFMTTHSGSYPQLADAGNLEAVRGVERRLNTTLRYRLDEDEIAGAADGIRSGDVIAATSTVRGLDIAHTGLAILVDGRVHLMHAPLAGGVVEISEAPLSERIQRIGGQDGVMVARPR